MTILESHITPPEAAGQRLSDYACIAFEKIIPSRKGIKKAIKRGCILVDGAQGSTGWVIRAGQRLELLSDYTKIPKIYELDIKVLFENQQYAVVCKPHGLITSGNQYRNLYNTLGYNLEKSTATDALPYPTPCHRLDKETYGCVLVAKTKSAQIEINKLFAERKIHKTYSAIVHGRIPKHGQINLPIKGQRAETKFVRTEILRAKSQEQLSIVKMYPVTGRTHQLRIHFQKIGHPLLGDHLYGRDGNILKHKGLFLCATALQSSSSFARINIEEDVSNKYKRFIRLLNQ